MRRQLLACLPWVKRCVCTRLLGSICWMVFVIGISGEASAALDLAVNAPKVQAVTRSMQARHAQLLVFYQSGVVGLTADGLVAVRDASQLPLPQRPPLNALVQAENQDRQALYLAIAEANGHPEWAGEIQRTFAQRWIDKAQKGWFMLLNGTWQQK